METRWVEFSDQVGRVDKHRKTRGRQRKREFVGFIVDRVLLRMRSITSNRVFIPVTFRRR